MNSLFKVSALNALYTIFRMVIGFVIVKVVAVLTGPTGLAMLGQFQGFVSVISGVVNAPAGNGVIRYTAETKELGFDAAAPWWRAALRWVIYICIAIIPFGVIASEYISLWLFKDIKFTWLIIVTFLTLPIVAIGTLCNSVLNGLQQYIRFVLSGVAAMFVSSVCMVILIYTYDINGTLLAVAIQAVLVGLVLFAINFRQPWLRFKYWFGEVDCKAKQQIGGYLLMAITSAITVPVSLILIRNLLVQYVGWEQAGHWQAVWKISEVYLAVITMTLATYFLPRLASLKSTDQIVSEVHKAALLVIPVVVLASVLIYLLKDTVITLLLSDDFLVAGDLFLLQLCGDVVKIASWLYAYPMLSRGATKWFISTEILCSISFVALSYMLIVNVGVKGVVIAYLINYILYFFIVFFNIRKFSK